MFPVGSSPVVLIYFLMKFYLGGLAFFFVLFVFLAMFLAKVGTSASACGSRLCSYRKLLLEKISKL